MPCRRDRCADRDGKGMRRAARQEQGTRRAGEVAGGRGRRTPGRPSPATAPHWYAGPGRPDGLTEDDNIVVRVEGHDPDSYAEHQKIPHWEVGEQLGILDVDRGEDVRFDVRHVPGAGASFGALINYGLDRNRDAFEEIRPPTVVKTDTMIGAAIFEVQ